MKTLISKAKDFRLSVDQLETILACLAILGLILCFIVSGFLIGRRSMTSGESMVVDSATYECRKTNELVGKSF
jgi:hypothetical protein